MLIVFVLEFGHNMNIKCHLKKEKKNLQITLNCTQPCVTTVSQKDSPFLSAPVRKIF